MLLCEKCHTMFDNKAGQRYSSVTLKKWKREHETRIRTVTEIEPDHKTCIETYTNIGSQNLHLDPNELISAIFPDKYPISSTLINLSTIPYESSGGQLGFTSFAIAPQRGSRTATFKVI